MKVSEYLLPHGLSAARCTASFQRSYSDFCHLISVFYPGGRTLYRQLSEELF